MTTLTQHIDPDIFNQIYQLVVQESGLHFEGKYTEKLVTSIARTAEAQDMDIPAFLAALIKDEHFLLQFLETLTVNYTSFFRDVKHFDYLAQYALPDLLLKHRLTKKIKIWSAGCSTGEEPFSLALQIQEYFDSNGLQDWIFEIHGSDINASVLAKARTGIYRLDKLRQIPKKHHAYLKIDEDNNTFTISEDIKKHVHFFHHNLMRSPLIHNIDIIWCRNVITYFSKSSCTKLLRHFDKSLSRDGVFMISSSEKLDDTPTFFTRVNYKEGFYVYKHTR